MESIIERSFGLNLKLLKVFRLYSENKLSRLQKVLVCIVYVLICSFIPIFGITYVMLERKSADVVRLSIDGWLVADVSFMVFKFLPFILNGDEIKKCIKRFESSIFKTFNDTQKRILDDCVKVCRRNFMIYLTIALTAYIIWTTGPLFIKDQIFPVDVWLPFDPKEKQQISRLVYLYTCLGAGYPGFATAAIDPLIGGLAYLATGQLKVLKDNLQHLDKDAAEEARNSNTNEIISVIIYRKIGECSKRYVAIINWVQDYEDCFSQVVFCQLCGSMLGICFCCFQLSIVQTKESDDAVLLTALGAVAFLSLTIQIYFYCYYGTQLFEESNSIVDAIYMGRWYNYDIKSRKALILFMERSKRPLVVNAGKILELSLNTFSTTLKRSYSLLAVLNSQSGR